MSVPIKVETTLRAVAERDFGVTVDHVKHIPVKQTAYYSRGRRLPLQRHPQTGAMFTVDKTTRTLIIADGEA